MLDAFSASDVRAAEKPLLAAERGVADGLMHRAATGLARIVRRELRVRRGRVTGASVVGLVGGGNNGADTLYALAMLAGRGVRVVAVLTSGSVHDGGAAAVVAAGGGVLRLADSGPGRPVGVGGAVAEVLSADVVLDGLVGIGSSGALRSPAGGLVGLLGERLGAVDRPGRGPMVIAVDVPSGTGVDDGALPGPVLAADLTVTFGVPKPGLLLPPAARCAGRVEVVELGLGAVLSAQGRRPVVSRVEADDVRAAWPVPDAAAHKYSRGVVGVVAGSTAYPGAAVLTVAGALGAGCPLLRYVGPGAVRSAVLTAHPEVVAGSGRVQAWVVGPGVATDDTEQHQAVRTAVARGAEDGLPVVADAGALAVLPDRLGPLVVLTPHAGELATLLSARGRAVDREQVETEPLRWAQEAQRLTGATVLLKGATTLVVADGGIFAQAGAPPWLATAGAGDVLAGVLGTVLAGRAGDLRHRPELVGRLAAVAVLVHGRAAHAANPGGPVTASAVAAALPAVLAHLLTPAVPDGPSRGATASPGAGRATRRPR